MTITSLQAVHFGRLQPRRPSLSSGIELAGPKDKKPDTAISPGVGSFWGNPPKNATPPAHQRGFELKKPR